MKKQIICTIIVILLAFTTKAQMNIGFSKSYKTLELTNNHVQLDLQIIPDDNNSKNPTEDFFITIELTINGAIDAEGIVKQEVSEKISVDSNNIKIRFPVLQEFIKKDDVLNFKLTGKSDKSITLTKTSLNVFISSSEKIKERKYNLHIGTNFDLKDRFETNSFYSEIDVFLPSLVKYGSYKFGIRGGIYKNNSVSTLEEQERDFPLVSIEENSITNDSLTIITSRVSSTPSVSYENLGFYAGILYTITENKQKNQKFEIFASLHFELIQRTESYSYDNELLFPIQTSRISLDSLASNSLLQSRLARNRDRTRKYYSSYIGIGFPMRYNNKQIEVFLNPMFGAGDPGFSIKGNDHNKTFGLIQFHLMEKKFGIKLSGDIRRYWGFRQDPIITLNLSKSFDLTKLFESNQ